MCTVQEEQIISCQLHFATLGDNNYDKSIENVIEIIKESKLDYTTGSISTVIRGTPTQIYSLLNTISSMVQNSKYIMNILISNTCGCNT